MIIFGKNAINQAYTVNSNFTDATMVMDDREDMLIDVVLVRLSTICRIRRRCRPPARRSTASRDALPSTR